MSKRRNDRLGAFAADPHAVRAVAIIGKTQANADSLLLGNAPTIDRLGRDAEPQKVRQSDLTDLFVGFFSA
ncbi:hypothetical protein D3C87_473890 [compost metagenome]